tara:strand:+ start:219 stop:590 length:372 start_codon:yes stop_codon:yes gene_type:complete
MGQRVNIQYSVELEDLEKEVSRLYSNAISLLIALPDGSINLDIEGLDKVESFRHKLAKVDIMLGDVQNIIEGYVRFKTQPPPERETPFQSNDLEVDPEALQDKISKFKELLNENTNQEPPVQN